MTAEQITLATTTASSVAFRNAIFKAIPSAIFTTVIKNIKTYIKENLEGSSVINDALGFFRKKGVTDQQIKERLRVLSLEKMDSEDLFLLIGLKNAVNDGDTTVSQIFGVKNTKKPSRPSQFQFDEADSEQEKPAIPKEEVVSDEKKEEEVKSTPTGGVKSMLSNMSQPLDEAKPEETEEVKEETEEVQLIPRPRGRTPKGMKWDGVKGEYTPIEETSA